MKKDDIDKILAETAQCDWIVNAPATDYGYYNFRLELRRI
jgi:hypothetical protein